MNLLEAARMAREALCTCGPQQREALRILDAAIAEAEKDGDLLREMTEGRDYYKMKCRRWRDVARRVADEPNIDTARAIVDAEFRSLGESFAEVEAAKPVAWMDDFGNAFPLAAIKGAGTWLDDHQRNWKPLYLHPKEQK